MYNHGVSLTVIIPIGDWYKDRKKIIENCKKCSSQNIQILLILDDETEQALEDITNYFASNIHVRVIPYDGRNPGGARNRGLIEVNTEWVLFCDADDYINIHELESLLCESRVLNFDAVVGGYRVQKKSGSVRSPRVSSLQLINRILATINPGIWRWVFRYESIKELEFPLSRIGEDQIFLMRFLVANPLLMFNTKRRIYTYVQANYPSLSSSFSPESLKQTIETAQLMDLNKVTFLNKFMIVGMLWRMSTTWNHRSHAPLFIKILRNARFGFKAISSLVSNKTRWD